MMASPQFSSSQLNPFGLADVGLFATLSFVDIDKDGDFDAFAGNSNGEILYYKNTGTAERPNFVSSIIPNPFGLQDVGSNANVTFVDIDKDGDFDAFVGNSDGDTVYYQNTGTANNANFVTPVLNPFGLQNTGVDSTPEFVDIDGDGDLDAFFGQADGSTTYLQNTGTANNANFADPITNPFGLQDVGNFSSPDFVDADKDGDFDAFLGNEDGNILYFQNTGTVNSANFAAPVINPSGIENVGIYSSPELIDINNDGIPDAFIGKGDGTTEFFRGLPTISITSNISSVREGEKGFYTLSRGSLTKQDLNITLSRSGTASFDSLLGLFNDYTLCSNGNNLTGSTINVVIPNGQSEVKIAFEACKDLLWEKDESAILTITNSPNYFIEPEHISATITIQNSPLFH